MSRVEIFLSMSQDVGILRSQIMRYCWMSWI